MKLIFAEYRKYLPHGAVVLLVVWLTALATVVFLPGPYRLDFFGVIAERTANTSSATIGLTSIITSMVILPLSMVAIDRYKRR